MRVLVWNGPWDLTVVSRDDPEPGAAPPPTTIRSEH